MNEKDRLIVRRQERIVDIGPKAPRVEPEFVAEALGGEPMTPGEVQIFLNRVHGIKPHDGK